MAEIIKKAQFKIIIQKNNKEWVDIFAKKI